MFTSKLEEITYEKIKRFCEEQNPEGETIEYKADFPSDLEKSISAMANTYGGIILIGVEANQTTNTPIPIKGRELTKGLEEKITSICLRKIYPPYYPSVKVCPFKNEKGEDKCVVFIKVHESDQTPHAINNNTDVYLRIRSQNEPLKKGTLRKATLDEIDWLKNRRQKAIENRERVIKIAQQRFDSLPYDIVDQVKLKYTHKDLYSSYRRVSIIPLYPSKHLLEYSELPNLRDIFNNSLDQVFYLDKPISSSGSLSCPLVQHDNSGNPVNINYTEFNIFGLVFNKQSLWENLDPETKELFDVSYFIMQIYRVVTVGRAIYEKFGYFGNVMIDTEAGAILGKRICVVDNKRENYHWCVNRLEPDIHMARISSIAELNENLESLVIEICKELLWSCGGGDRVKESEKILKNLYKRAKDYFP